MGGCEYDSGWGCEYGNGSGYGSEYGGADLPVDSESPMSDHSKDSDLHFHDPSFITPIDNKIVAMLLTSQLILYILQKFQLCNS